RARLAVGVGVERSAGMEADVIVKKLDVAWLELVGDVEILVVGDGVEQVHRFDLLRREARHLGKALRVDDLAADVAAGELAVLDAEDLLRGAKLLARGLLLVSPPVSRLGRGPGAGRA